MNKEYSVDLRILKDLSEQMRIFPERDWINSPPELLQLLHIWCVRLGSTLTNSFEMVSKDDQRMSEVYLWPKKNCNAFLEIIVYNAIKVIEDGR